MKAETEKQGLLSRALRGARGRRPFVSHKKLEKTNKVTRYFGGILLGAGGLVRAYAHGAKIAVDAAGRSIKRIWTNVYLPCPYSWYERIRLEVAAFGGMIRETQFGADVELDLLLPEEQTQGFLERVTDLSAGTIEGLIGKQEYRAFPLP